jgi:hypothetical protein
LPIQIHQTDRRIAGFDSPIDPIAWIGMGPVTISKLSPQTNLPLKSQPSDHPPKRNHAHRSRKGEALVLGGPEQMINKSNR